MVAGGSYYAENSNCSWLIAPAGATQVSINFTSFNTEIKIFMEEHGWYFTQKKET